MLVLPVFYLQELFVIGFGVVCLTCGNMLLDLMLHRFLTLSCFGVARLLLDRFLEVYLRVGLWTSCLTLVREVVGVLQACV